MKFMLDTNICIYIIKQKPPQVLAKFQAYPLGAIGISSITVAELEYGVQKSHWIEKNKRALQQFLLPLNIVEFDYPAATVYGHVRTALEKQGTPMGALDTLIAAHALSLNVTLITNNAREFSRIPNLRIANWVQ